MHKLQSIRICSRSREVVQKRPFDDMLIDEMLDDGYDQFVISLQKLQVLLHAPGDRWMEKLEKGNSFTHILASTEAVLDIRKALVRT